MSIKLLIFFGLKPFYKVKVFVKTSTTKLVMYPVDGKFGWEGKAAQRTC